MKKYILSICCIVLFIQVLPAQKYYSKTGTIHFLSDAPMEKIEAINSNAYVVFDQASGQMEWSVLIQGFKFDKALMQDHFNENYLESHKFPKGIFKGKIIDLSGVNTAKDGIYNTEVSGNLTLHGVTKLFKAPGRVTVKNGMVSVNSAVDLTIGECGNSVPKVVRENIAKTVQVTVNADLQRLEK